MKKIKDKKKINELLHRIVFNLLQKLPEDVTKGTPPITFYFEESAIFFQKKHLVFAACQDGFGSKEIIFYIDLISRAGTTKQGLNNLVLHEFGHALGMNEERATKLVENLRFKL